MGLKSTVAPVAYGQPAELVRMTTTKIILLKSFMQGANSWGRTLVVLSSAMSTPSGSQGLTNLRQGAPPFIQK